MVAGMNKSPTVLNGERCFHLWAETGSVYKVQKRLADEGLINPKTGRVPTPMGIWWACWLWAIENKSEAKLIMESIYRLYGELLSDEEWEKMIEEKKHYIYAKRSKKGKPQ